MPSALEYSWHKDCADYEHFRNAAARPYHGPLMRPSARAPLANTTTFQAIVSNSTPSLFPTPFQIKPHHPNHPATPIPDSTTHTNQVDSGTTLIYLPTDLANTINAVFNPPAVFDFFEGAYVVDCNATAPTLGFQIGGEVLYVNPVDLILDDGSGEGLCISGVDDASYSGLAILGDVFLKNVVGELISASLFFCCGWDWKGVLGLGRLG